MTITINSFTNVIKLDIKKDFLQQLPIAEKDIPGDRNSRLECFRLFNLCSMPRVRCLRGDAYEGGGGQRR